MPALDNLVKLWKHLSPSRHKQCVLLLLLMIVSALAEILSIGTLLPFLAALAAPEKVMAQPKIAMFANELGITSASDIVLPLTLLFISAAFCAGMIRLLVLWATTRLTFAAGADVSMQMYRRTLYQPYAIHTNRNSSEVISAITNKTNTVMFDTLLPSLIIINSCVLLVFICSALLFINPQIALSAAGGFGVCYVVIAKLMHGKLVRNGQTIAREQTQLVKILQEGLGGIRDVLLDGTQGLYCSIYQQSDAPLRRAQGRNLFISGSPRYLMESIGMMVIAALAFYLSKQGGIAEALPVLGALAVGAQRLLPAFQQGYNSWSLIMGNQAALRDALALLEQPMPMDAFFDAPDALPFTRELRLEKLAFRYGENLPNVLNIPELVIGKGKRIGFAGTTGSGKSTLLDIIMGLLSPSEGLMVVDGVAITAGNRRAWQRNIAHVPQNIFLADGSFAENIAFGVAREMIDMERVKKAAAQAQIDDFIEQSQEGYSTHVGERGIRLSGGQRQRIGIARALYKQANILVLDEATSALDTQTESSVMDAIEQLDRELTILIVAHRLSTLEKCDMVVQVKNGDIECQK